MTDEQIKSLMSLFKMENKLKPRKKLEMAIELGVRGKWHYRIRHLPLFAATFAFSLDLGILGGRPGASTHLPLLAATFTFSQSLGILGGRPGASTYLIGVQEDKVFYLDPHEVQQEVSVNKFLDQEVTVESLEEFKSEIGVIGFGPFDLFLAKTMIKQGHLISEASRSDHSAIAGNLGVYFIRQMEEFLGLEHDVILICTSIMSVSKVVNSIPFHYLKRPTLFADVLSVKEHPRQILLQEFPEDSDLGVHASYVWTRKWERRVERS
ncbi:bifunctional chorismate mutase/prephenate dehydrogenase T-protein [Tanacetum coccineum]